LIEVSLLETTLPPTEIFFFKCRSSDCAAIAASSSASMQESCRNHLQFIETPSEMAWLEESSFI
jgi:hypothetical protein